MEYIFDALTNGAGRTRTIMKKSRKKKKSFKSSHNTYYIHTSYVKWYESWTSTKHRSTVHKWTRDAITRKSRQMDSIAICCLKNEWKYSNQRKRNDNEKKHSHLNTHTHTPRNSSSNNKKIIKLYVMYDSCTTVTDQQRKQTKPFLGCWNFHIRVGFILIHTV